MNKQGQTYLTAFWLLALPILLLYLKAHTKAEYIAAALISNKDYICVNMR